ncbi:MAG: AIPR family protein [Rhodospirillales bacterium]|nr:AIPR family protein [Rhodospirillales bacterium]
MKDLVLQGFVRDFAEGRGLSGWDESRVFEAFSASSILRKYHHSDVSEVDEVLTGGGADGGIDSCAILINGHLVRTTDDIEFFIGRLKRLDVEFVFMQAKTSTPFETAQIGKFVHGVEQFFLQNPDIQFRDEVEILRTLKNNIYSKSIYMEQNPKCSLYYITTGSWKDEAEPASMFKQGCRRLDEMNLFSEVHATPIDAERLKTIYRELERRVVKEVELTKTAVFPQIEDVREAYVGLLSGDQFIRLITTADGDLNRELFYDNVRDFQGNNPVNNEISQTVSNKIGRGRFALLNNGVTIVARSIKRTGDIFKISDFQIVNGCQTTHILFQHRDLIDSSTYVPMKLVVTDNSDIITEVIKATNRQTAVLPEALESLSPFHKDLEDYYTSRQNEMGNEARIYYERRSKQYALDRIKPGNIITLTAQTKSFVAMFLNEPHSHPRYYGELLKAYEQRLFVHDHKPAPYFASGFAFFVVENLFNRGQLDRTFRKYKFHVLMLLRIQIAGAVVPKINSGSIDAYSQKLVDAFDDDKACLRHCQTALDTIREQLNTFKQGDLDPSRLRAFTAQLIDRATHKECIPMPDEQRPPMGHRETGEIVWFNEEKGFGFIKRSAGGDIFVHRTGISAVPWHLRNAGTKVSYVVAEGRDSLKADGVKLEL